MPYRLLMPIGFGSLGEVWQAELQGVPAGSLIRAQKTSFRTLDDPIVRRELSVYLQFVRLTHTGLLPIHDLSHSPQGRLSVVMELADESLMDWMKRVYAIDVPNAIDELLRYIREVAAALDYLREKKVVHGGLNPTDILLCAGRAKIGDFGPIPFQHSQCDQQTIPFHKFVCMSPELRCGEPSAHSDQYALAATYAWLRQKHPLFCTVPGGPMELNIAASRERDVLLTALADEPQSRFSTCLEFVSALMDAVRPRDQTG